MASLENIVYRKNKVLSLFEAYPNPQVEILTLVVRDLAKLLNVRNSGVRKCGLEG